MQNVFFLSSLTYECTQVTPPVPFTHTTASQAFTLELALRVLETSPAAQTTVQSPLRWSADHSWKRDYSNAAMLSADELTRRRHEFDRQKQIARDLRETAA